jgi:hypothetical protein
MILYSWANNNLNLQLNYKKIVEEFCENFYYTFDSQFDNLKNYFYGNALVTFADFETVGFDNVYNKCKNHGIYKIRHGMTNISAQPIDQNHIFILSTGTISFNDGHYKNYSESFIIEKKDVHICIMNYILCVPDK